jgi:hypothetical protein
VNLQETGPQTGPTREHRSDSKSAQSDFTLPDLPPRPAGRWFMGGAIALMVTVALGVFGFTRPQPMVTMIRPAPSGIASAPVPLVEPAPVSAAVVPEHPAEPESPLLPVPAYVSPANGKPKEDSLLAAWSGVESHPRPQPAKSSGRAAAPPRVAVKTGEKSPQWPALVDPWARPAASSAVAAPQTKTCSVRFGTRPWAEVWIDGKNTGGHTPYSDAIPCGVHTVTFKRRDLGLSKTYTITARAGEPLRESFPFVAGP